jgi:hypothetical protein
MSRMARRLIALAAAIGLAISAMPVRVMSVECLAANRNGKCPVCDGVESAALAALPPCCRAAMLKSRGCHVPKHICRCVLRVGEDGVFARTPVVRPLSVEFPAIVPDAPLAVADAPNVLAPRCDASDSGPPRRTPRLSESPRAPPAPTD